jgi:hypothetical protein
MLRKFSLCLTVISTVIATSPGFLLAQAADPKREKKAQEVKQKVQKLGTGKSAVVTVKLYNDTEYKGYVSRTGDEDFEVTDTASNPHTVKYSDVRSIGGRNMSTGTKIAIGVGIGAGVTLLILLLIFNELGKNS